MQIAVDPTDSKSAQIKRHMAPGADSLSIWTLVAKGTNFISFHCSGCCLNWMCFSLVICIFELQDVEGKENV